MLQRLPRVLVLLRRMHYSRSFHLTRYVRDDDCNKNAFVAAIMW